MDRNLHAALTNLEGAARHLKRQGIPDEDLPDAAGRIRAVEKILAGGIRLPLTKELDRGTHRGLSYAVKVGKERKRNFNGVAIIDTLAAKKGWSFTDALVHLLSADALRLDFRWTNLERTMGEAQCDLRIQNTELGPDVIGDPDGPHVGQWWKDKSPEIVGLAPDDGGS